MGARVGEANDSILHMLIRKFEVQSGMSLAGTERLFASNKVTTLRDKEPAFQLGETCQRVYAVRQGCLKQLYFDEKGKEAIKSFAGPGDLFACPFALHPHGRTTFASISIGHSVIESVAYREIESLAENDINWQKAMRMAFQRLSELKVQREKDLLMLSAEELYQQFARDRPDLLELISQKDLAAYLGVTPVGLNRIIRRQI